MSGNVRHETSDVNVRAILTVGAGLAAGTAAVCALIWLLVVFLAGRETQTGPREYPLAVTHEQRLPPEPRLQTNPREDLAGLRQAEDQVLESYGWVDKDAGIVRIPVDAAMRLMVERGLPVRPQEPSRK